MEIYSTLSESHKSGKASALSPDRRPTLQNGSLTVDTNINDLSPPSTNIDPVWASGSPERKMDVDEPPSSRPLAVRPTDGDILHDHAPSYNTHDSLREK